MSFHNIEVWRCTNWIAVYSHYYDIHLTLSTPAKSHITIADTSRYFKRFCSISKWTWNIQKFFAKIVQMSECLHGLQYTMLVLPIWQSMVLAPPPQSWNVVRKHGKSIYQANFPFSIVTILVRSVGLESHSRGNRYLWVYGIHTHTHTLIHRHRFTSTHTQMHMHICTCFVWHKGHIAFGRHFSSLNITQQM